MIKSSFLSLFSLKGPILEEKNGKIIKIGDRKYSHYLAIYQPKDKESFINLCRSYYQDMMDMLIVVPQLSKFEDIRNLILKIESDNIYKNPTYS